MTNILNAQEAFTALRSGKTVLCRHILGEFDTLDQFPATVFGLPDHEYCIKIETIELAGITFTKPLTLEEVQPEQDVFLIQPHAVIQQYKFNEKIDELVDGIHAGFAQRDFENAQLQYKAFCEAVGGTPIQVNLEIVEQPKKKRASKKQNDSNSIVQQSTHAANDDVSLDDIIGPVGDQKLTSNDVEKKTLDEIPTPSEIQNNPISFDSVAAAVVNKAKEIDVVTLENNSKKLANDESEYHEKLATLKQRVDESKTVTEVNAVVKYTTGWTTEQLSPLLKYMHKRLEVLQQNKAAEQPSLMVRIQNAPDLTVLDALEIDVSSLDPVIQPEMMRYVRTRRLELEKASCVAINDEDLP